MISATTDYVNRYPVATKRVLRSILKAADLCVSDPQWVAQQMVDRDFVPPYDYALQTLNEIRYDRWRDFDPEDSLRFYALRMQETGMIKSSSAEDHRRRHRLALPQRAEARAEDLIHLAALGLWLAVLVGTTPSLAHTTSHEQRLPSIGPALEFELTSQDGKTVALHDFRGRVLAIAFIYTSCPDVCPLLTEKMAQVQDELGPDFGTRIAFVSITVDPENDTPAALGAYAESHGANLAGWNFLTGAPKMIGEVAQRYGVAVSRTADGQVEHTLLTTLVDKHGQMRVQYLGFRFDPEEFRHDLLELLHEP